MEVDITRFLNEACPLDYSNSIANSGNPNIGRETWERAKGEIKFQFVTEENREEFLDYFLSFGAWEREEIDTIEELNGLFIQLVSGGINECSNYDLDTEAGREEMEADVRDGRISGRICWPWQSIDGKAYYYIGE